MKLRAKDWNEAMRDITSRYPLSVKVEASLPPTHAWSVDTLWDAPRKKWTAKIKPGSVNCRIPTVPMLFSSSPEAFQKYIKEINPGKQYTKNTRVNVPLHFEPTIDLAWREIGEGAPPESTTVDANNGIKNTYETVPTYFKKRGVLSAGATGFDANLQCRLYACDLVLSMPRPYLVNEIDSLPGGALGGSIISVDAKPVIPPDLSEPPSIYATPKFVVPLIQNSFADIFFQRFLDEPKDDLHLSTIYALSPPKPSGSIDSTHKLETRYYCHYNLIHGTAQVVPRVITPPITLVTGLGAGLGDVVFNAILATANDFAQSVLDLFQQRSLRGMFWVV